MNVKLNVRLVRSAIETADDFLQVLDAAMGPLDPRWLALQNVLLGIERAADELAGYEHDIEAAAGVRT